MCLIVLNAPDTLYRLAILGRYSCIAGHKLLNIGNVHNREIKFRSISKNRMINMQKMYLNVNVVIGQYLERT